MSCPDLNVLVALAEGREAPPALAGHLGSCPACREEVAAIRADLETRHPEPDPRDRAQWKTLALGASDRPGRVPWRKPLAWAAAVLLLAGGWMLVGDPFGEAPPPAAPPQAPASPAWLADGVWEAGKGKGATPFLLGGVIPGAASAQARFRAEGTRLSLEAGEVYLAAPEGISCQLQGPEGAWAKTAGGALWARRNPTSPTAAWSLLTSVWAVETGAFQVSVVSGTAELSSIPGEAPLRLDATGLAEWREGRWKILEGQALPEGVSTLRRLLPSAAGTAWTNLRAAETLPLPQGGWALGPGDPAWLAAGAAPPQGTLTVTLKRPPSQTDVLLVFPQPGGSRAWRLGDWSGRRFSDLVTLTVAYGPWGARGYVDGQKAWTLGPGAASLSAAPPGLEIGVVASGGRLEIRDAKRMAW
jgi:hypothetical protein